MKHIVTMALALCVALAAFACSSSEFEPVGEQASAVNTFYTSTNATTSNVPTDTQVCHPIAIRGIGANSQSFILPGNVPECGGSALVNPSNWQSSWPNVCQPQGSRQGTMILSTMCEPLSNFHGNLSLAAISNTTVLSWGGNGALQAVSGSARLWNVASACWLTGVASMSVGNEYASLTQSGGDWFLNMAGFRSLTGMARCAYLGRHVLAYGQALATTSIRNVSTGMASSQGTCFITQIDGNVGDGGVELSQTTGTWRLIITGGITAARAHCVTYN